MRSINIPGVKDSSFEFSTAITGLQTTILREANPALDPGNVYRCRGSG
jgi:hypothetical protein